MVCGFGYGCLKESKTHVVAELALHKYRGVQGCLSSELDHYEYFASRFHSRQIRTIIVLKVLDFARNNTGLHNAASIISHCACPPFEWRKERDSSLRSEQAVQSPK